MVFVTGQTSNPFAPGGKFNDPVGPPIEPEPNSSVFSGFKSWLGSSSKPQQDACKKTCETTYPKSGGRKSRRRKNKKNKRKSLRRKK